MRVNATDWNERYAAQELLWGAEPNRFVAEALARLEPRGRALDLACGEGRNAIWLAKLGWKVTAVDYAHVAVDRGRRLAAAQHVDVDWVEADVTTYTPETGAYQLVLVAYLHLPPESWRVVLARVASALAAGGTLFMVGHARLNLIQGVGGPRQPEVLWEPSEVGHAVAALGLDVQRAEHVRRPVDTAEGVAEAIDTIVRASRNAN